MICHVNLLYQYELSDLGDLRNVLCYFNQIKLDFFELYTLTKFLFLYTLSLEILVL